MLADVPPPRNNRVTWQGRAASEGAGLTFSEGRETLFCLAGSLMERSASHLGASAERCEARHRLQLQPLSLA